MGPPQSKVPLKIDENKIIEEAEKWIEQQALIEKNDDYYSVYKLIIARIKLYGHHHLLKHLQTKKKEKKIKFLNQWRNIKFQDIDLLFQNLVKQKITQIEEFIIDPIDFKQKRIKNQSDIQIVRDITEIGQHLLKNNKVGLIVFVGNSGHKYEQNFHKEFYKQKPNQKCIFEILLEKLSKIGENYGFPNTIIFYNSHNYIKINQYLSKYPHKDKIQTCIQNSHPIVNLNGNLCLKDKQYGDIVELPNGSGDFYHSTIKGVNILQKFKSQGIEYVSCIDCQNILEKVLDPYILGLLRQNNDILDVIYKCTYPENQKEKIFKRVCQVNKINQVNNLEKFMGFLKYNSKQRSLSYENLLKSPVWMNSLIFNLERVSQIFHAKNIQIFPQMFSVNMKHHTYWSPMDQQYHKEEPIYVFERQLSDLLINSLFRSQGIMVEREEEYYPVISKDKEYCWKEAYEEYLEVQKMKTQAQRYLIKQSENYRSVVNLTEQNQYE